MRGRRIRRLEARHLLFQGSRLTGPGAEGSRHVGVPALKGASVAAEIVKHGRGEKIIVFKQKRRKNYARKQGHRQGFTEIKIGDITLA